MNIYNILDTNEIYRDIFQGTRYPPLPEEGQGWNNDGLQELFCVLFVAHTGEGMTVEEAGQRIGMVRSLEQQTVNQRNVHPRMDAAPYGGA